MIKLLSPIMPNHALPHWVASSVIPAIHGIELQTSRFTIQRITPLNHVGDVYSVTYTQLIPQTLSNCGRRRFCWTAVSGSAWIKKNQKVCRNDIWCCLIALLIPAPCRCLYSDIYNVLFMFCSLCLVVYDLLFIRVSYPYCALQLFNPCILPLGW